MHSSPGHREVERPTRAFREGERRMVERPRGAVAAVGQRQQPIRPVKRERKNKS